MTVETLEFRREHVGDAVTVEFNVPFRFIADADLAVYLGTVRQLLGVDYTVAGAQTEDRGVVVMTRAPAAGAILLIELDPELKQPTRYRAGTEFPAEDVEDDFDRAVQRDRWLRDAVDRSVKAQRGSTANMTLPPYAAGGRFGWHASRNEVALFFDQSSLGFVTSQDLELPETGDVGLKLQEAIDEFQAGSGARIILRATGAGFRIDTPVTMGPGAAVSLEFVSPILLGRAGKLQFRGRPAEDVVSIQVSASYLAGDTTITLAGAQAISVGDYISIRSTPGGENVGVNLHEARVTAISWPSVTITPALPFQISSAGTVTRRLSKLLTVSPPKWANTVTVASAADFPVGGMVQIEDDSLTDDVAGSSGARTHIEQARVVAAVGTTVTLDTRLARSYSTSRRARITRILPCQGCSIVGAQVIHREEAGAERVDVFDMIYADDCYTVDCAVHGTGDRGSRGQHFRFFRSLRCFHVRPRALNPQYRGPGEGYGVGFLQSTMCSAVAVESIGCRHGAVFEGETRCFFEGVITDHLYAAIDCHGENGVGSSVDVTVHGGRDGNGGTAIAVGHNENFAGDHDFTIRRLLSIGADIAIEVLAPSTNLRIERLDVYGARHVLQIQDQIGQSALTVDGVDIMDATVDGITDYLVNIDGRANGGSTRPITNVALTRWRARNCIKGFRLRYAQVVRIGLATVRDFTPNVADYAFIRALDVTKLAVDGCRLTGVGRPVNLSACPDAEIVGNGLNHTLEPTVEMVDSPRALIAFNTISASGTGNLEVLDENGGSDAASFVANLVPGRTAVLNTTSTGNFSPSLVGT